MSIRAWNLAGSAAADPEDLAIARRCARGDERAMRAVFNEHEPRLRALAHRMLGNAQDAEEIASATFLKFWRGSESYRGDCSLRSYLTRIALNLIRDRVRRRPPPIPPMPDDAPQHDEELMARINDGLLRLDSDDRELLALYYLDGNEYEEICQTLGIGYDVLRTRLVRARKRLRRAIGVDDE